ncbi:MAG TPA: NAD-binding protein [Solirubrobacteraceae bacterium]|jgi:Trk K+ transport system NAD-binding subunit|nr:NAD-binding protein [Solirubrobacteraceae bacterium]
MGPQEDVGTAQIVLVIGQGQLVDVARRVLDQGGAGVIHLPEPADGEIRAALDARVDAVMVIARDDRVSLRLALVVEHLCPGVRLIVTIYNRDLGAELRRAVPNVRVMSMADIVAPSLAAACLGDDMISAGRSADGMVAIRQGPGGPVAAPLAIHPARSRERLLANIGSLVHPYELSAKTLLAGLMGFALILVLDSLVIGLELHESFVNAVYFATKTIVTVGPNTLVDHGPAWLKLYSAATMLAALAFTAVFIAGLIDRLLDRRLVALVGRRAMPRRDHVVVVGLGQVGLRLCMMLQELGVPVVAIERDPEADNVRRARQYNIPVVLGRGSSRAILHRLSLERARAIAAVTSDEVENIAAAVAALAIRANLRTVLRAGSGDLLDETRALFRIGAVRDVYLIGGTFLAAAALGSSAEGAFLIDETVWVIAHDGSLEDANAHLATATSRALEAGDAVPIDP